MALIDFAHRPTRIAAPRRSRTSLVRLLDLWRSRRALAQLDADRLEDIGLSRADAAREAAKPVWDVPHTWRD